MATLYETVEVGGVIEVNGIRIRVVSVEDGTAYLGFEDGVKEDVVLGEELQEA